MDAAGHFSWQSQVYWPRKGGGVYIFPETKSLLCSIQDSTAQNRQGQLFLRQVENRPSFSWELSHLFLHPTSFPSCQSSSLLPSSSHPLTSQRPSIPESDPRGAPRTSQSTCPCNKLGSMMTLFLLPRRTACDSYTVSNSQTGEGSDNALQYSCLESPLDRGAYGLQSMESQKSWTPLSEQANNSHQTLTVGFVFSLSQYLWSCKWIHQEDSEGREDLVYLSHLMWIIYSLISSSEQGAGKQAVFRIPSPNLDFPGGSDGKASAGNCNAGGLGLIPGSGRSPGEGNGTPLQDSPVLLPGESHGCRSLVGYSPWGCKELDTTEWLHFHSKSRIWSFLQFLSVTCFIYENVSNIKITKIKRHCPPVSPICCSKCHHCPLCWSSAMPLILLGLFFLPFILTHLLFSPQPAVPFMVLKGYHRLMPVLTPSLLSAPCQSSPSLCAILVFLFSW